MKIEVGREQLEQLLRVTERYEQDYNIVRSNRIKKGPIGDEDEAWSRKSRVHALVPKYKHDKDT